MSDEAKLALPDLENGEAPPLMDPGVFGNASDAESTTRGAADLEAVFDVPVKVSAVLGRARMEVGELLKLGPVPCSSSTVRSAKQSTSTSTTAWLPAARL